MSIVSSEFKNRFLEDLVKVLSAKAHGRGRCFKRGKRIFIEYDEPLPYSRVLSERYTITMDSIRGGRLLRSTRMLIENSQGSLRSDLLPVGKLNDPEIRICTGEELREFCSKMDHQILANRTAIRLLIGDSGKNT